MADVEMKATRYGFAQGVLEAAGADDRVVLLGLDVTGSLGLSEFGARYPERYLSLGIAEQNGASVAAGLAMSGYRPIFSTYATFATTRALDQIRVSICYNRANVVIGGAHSGVSVGPDGATHQALEDLATLRALPNMQIFSGADANETEAITRYVLGREWDGPVYIRFGRAAVPNFTSPGADFDPGVSEEMLSYGDGAVLLVATGPMVYVGMGAASVLFQQHGIGCRVVNVRRMKPFDGSFLCEAVRSGVRRVFTLEEHQVIGGLGSTVCESVCEQGLGVSVQRHGVQDRFGESGAPDEVMDYFGLTVRGVVEFVLSRMPEW